MGRRAEIEAGTSEEIAAITADEIQPSLILFDASADNRVRLLRRSEQTQKWIPHGYFPPDVTEEVILKEFGGGRYMAQLLVHDGKKEAIKQSRKFELTGPYRPPTGDVPGIRDQTAFVAGGSGTTVISPVTTGDNLMSMLNATVLSTFIDLIKTMKEASSRPAPPAVDPMLVEIMRSQSAMQAEVFKLVLPLVLGKGDSKKELLDLFAQFKDVLTPAPAVNPSDPNVVLKSIVGAIQQLRQVSDDLTPERTGDPLVDSLPKITELLMEEHRMKRAAMIAATNPQPIPLPAPNPTPQMPDGAPLWRKILHQQAPRLMASAQAGKSAEAMAVIAVEFAPDRGALVEFFHREPDKVLAQMVEEVPSLGQYPTWLLEFIDHVQFRLFPEEFDEGNEGEGTGGEGPEPEGEQ